MWPVSTAAQWPSARRHRRQVASAEAVASHWPSGENLTAATDPAWPTSVRCNLYGAKGAFSDTIAAEGGSE